MFPGVLFCFVVVGFVLVFFLLKGVTILSVSLVLYQSNVLGQLNYQTIRGECSFSILFCF